MGLPINHAQAGQDTTSVTEDDRAPLLQRQQMSVDQLDYLSDLISELREMSLKGGLTTLAAILALAHTEAIQQMTKHHTR